jgi:hypothetical protein
MRPMMLIPAISRRCSGFVFSLLLLPGVFSPFIHSHPQPSALAFDEAGLQPARPDITAEQIFAELMRHNDQRNAALHSYSARRSYAVSDVKGKLHAQEVVQVAYQAPDRKSFMTVSQKGSALVRRLVLHRLMESEAETVSGKNHHDTRITTANYTFTLLGEDDLGRNHCFVVEATPKRNEKYLFEGKIWIDAQDYAIVQIAGHPAKKLSIWIDKADFVRRYQKIGDFWLPLKDETSVHVRLYGSKILTIDHQQYTVNDQARNAQVQGTFNATE